MKNKITGYIGTYTKGDSKGIYKFSLDLESGKLENLSLAGEIGNPTYITISKDNKHLYSVAKLDNMGGAAAYSIEASNGELQLLNFEVAEGSSPCHVSMDKNNKYLLAANYHKGEALVYPVNSDGSIEAPSSVMKHEGFGPHKIRQEKAHAHYISLTPDEKYVCAIDLGIDKMIVYSLKDGHLKKQENLTVAVKPGSGPRHLVFHPNGKFAYILTELTAEVIVLEYNPYAGFKILQYISTLPEGFTGDNLASAVRITPDGQYLYAANRGHDSIALFKIDNTSGKLEFVEHTSSNINEPRDFNIDPTGSFLIAGNQNSNNIISFKIDKETGKLTEAGSTANVASPVCIQFMNM